MMLDNELVADGAAALHLEVAIMSAMFDATPTEYAGGYLFTFKWFEERIGLDREQLRGFLRSLRNRGLTQYGTGFDDEGKTAGGGYSLTLAGMDFVKKMKAFQDD